MIKLPRQFIPYIFSLLVVGTTILISIYVRPFAGKDGKGSLLLLISAVAIASWYGGLVPGLFATAISAAFVAYRMPPVHTFEVDNWVDIFRLSLFVVVALLISSLHSARERAERSLRESEQRLSFALDAAGIGCWDADIRAGTFWRSPNLPAIYSRTDHDFSTTYEGFFAYIHAEDRDFVRLATIKPESGNTYYKIVHRIVCSDGSIRWVTTRGQLFLNKQGLVDRMVGVVYALDKEPMTLDEPKNKSKTSDVTVRA